MNWLLLVVAGLVEAGWAIGLKYTDGFSKPIPTVLTILAMLVSVVMLGFASKNLPIGTAYSVWVGIGAVGVAIAGIVLFSEPANVARVVSITLILLGVVGLKLSHG
ncbi:quaternary ammonium compound efflux SMR transporter SugE [Candidatus Ozemobacteraceae bacterium]|nr:quaternary ammonium compound efflux SMR transporter SugE [Candidatus Ozemobacteraceae bacterium]